MSKSTASTVSASTATESTDAVTAATATVSETAADRDRLTAAARLVADYSAADKHIGTATLIRGRAVTRALSSGMTIAEVSSTLTGHYGHKVSAATLSNAGRAYRVVRDTNGVTASGAAGAANVGAVAAAINRGAVSALNDWTAAADGVTYTDESFLSAMRGLVNPEGSRTGKRATDTGDTTTPVETVNSTPAAPVAGVFDTTEAAETLDAVTAAELLLALGRRDWSEGELATLHAGLSGLLDSLLAQGAALTSAE